jgi:murein DD-endopeptidase MepM/ murein hydrolase activator NlpD
MFKKKTFKISLLILLAAVVLGYIPSYNCIIPVKDATTADWNKKSYWYYPWGKSVTHKGIDIFAKKGTPVLAAHKGIVIATGNNKYGGNYVLVLGAKWRLSYYAHLEEIIAKKLSIVKQGELIGKVGDTGNAKGKAPHLHFSIVAIIPKFDNIDNSIQGWKKMFYLNPTTFFKE